MDALGQQNGDNAQDGGEHKISIFSKKNGGEHKKIHFLNKQKTQNGDEHKISIFSG